MEDLRWEVVRLKEEVRAMRRELGEARGAREEMVRIYTQRHKYLHISTHSRSGYTSRCWAIRGSSTGRVSSQGTRDTSTVIYVIILSYGAGGIIILHKNASETWDQF